MIKNNFGFIAVILLLLFSSCAKKLIPFETLNPPLPAYRGPLHVQGNKVMDQNNNAVVLEGLNICYPTEVVSKGRWNEDYFKELAEWGVGIVRVPVLPGFYRTLGAEATFGYLDQAVLWAKNNGMYTMIDWHSIGNPVSDIFQTPWEEQYRTDAAEMKEFWGAVAERYKNEPAMAFYEIFNEPASMFWLGGTLTWEQWKAVADDVIDVIYSKNPNAIPVVGGLAWSFDHRDTGASPLRNTGVVYAAHPYPGHASEPWETAWQNYFGYLAASYPVMLTEFGYDPDDTIYPAVYKADDDYGNRIISFARQKGMSWTAFVFCKCDGWPMPLFTEWDNYTPTKSGALFKSKLMEKRR